MTFPKSHSPQVVCSAGSADLPSMLPWFLHLCDGGAGGLDQKGSKIPCPPGAPLLSPRRSFSSHHLSMASIMVVDSPGFQNPRHQGKDRAATFEELCHNYAHERLQLLFYQRTFISVLERFREVWLGWVGASGTHPAFSFMLSGPALIKTQTPGLTARASAPPLSPSVSHGLLQFRA